MAGILLQWQLQTDVVIWKLLILIFVVVFCSFFLLPLFQKYRSSWITGVCVTIIFLSLGAILTRQNDIRYNENWFGKNYKHGSILLVTLLENPIEKPKSLKAIAAVNFLKNDNTTVETKGKIIIYFKKDSLDKNLGYGSVIAFQKPLQEIKNSGNPGGFDYKIFCLFKEITHQVYLQSDDIVVLPQQNKTHLGSFLLSLQENILQIIRTNIQTKKEAGLAEALLIGYKSDLDKTLVQSYSNTGVVHIIAISGLHLGIIYWLLTILLKPLKNRKHVSILYALIIISLLWIFSLLTGAQPSIIRAAVMFTCITIGDSLSRKTNIYNSLAISAFLLLLYNPFWLWDVGFQLSYAAVLSIIIFARPIYNWFYIKNKLLDSIWKLNSITIAAQLLTTPISLFHFHQFPNYFLLTNFLAVPLSSIILIGEIFLCILSFIKPIALLLGNVLTKLIWVLNTHVENIEQLPFSIWEGIYINLAQMVLLLVTITAISYWLLEKNKRGLYSGLITFLILVVFRSHSIASVNEDKKLVVYNVPKYKAVDLIDGRYCFFIGDDELKNDDYLSNFHLKPSRIKHRVLESSKMGNFAVSDPLVNFGNKKILMIDRTVSFLPTTEKTKIDLVIISKNPKLYIKKLAEQFDIKQVVADGSAPAWKIKYWQADCESLNIPFFSTSEKGAFVMALR